MGWTVYTTSRVGAHARCGRARRPTMRTGDSGLLLRSKPLVREDDQLSLHVIHQRVQPVAVEAEGLPDRIAQDRAGRGPDGESDHEEDEDHPDRALVDLRREHVVEDRPYLLS